MGTDNIKVAQLAAGTLLLLLGACESIKLSGIDIIPGYIFIRIGFVLLGLVLVLSSFGVDWSFVRSIIKKRCDADKLKCKAFMIIGLVLVVIIMLPSDAELIKSVVTSESDGRKTKHLSCPYGKIIVPGTAKCMHKNKLKAKHEKQISNNIWHCEWENQKPGIDLWIEMVCKSPYNPELIDGAEYLQPAYSADGTGEVTKELDCPLGKQIIQGTAKCLDTSNYSVIPKTDGDTASCKWVGLEKGIGHWIEMACR